MFRDPKIRNGGPKFITHELIFLRRHSTLIFPSLAKRRKTMSASFQKLPGSAVVSQSFSRAGCRESLCVLIRSNKMQQYAGIYSLQVYSTRFGRPSRPSSGVQKTVTAASGTGHSNGATTFLQRGLIRPHWRKVVAPLL